MSDPLNLVKATASDIPAIRNLAMATWPAAFINRMLVKGMSKENKKA